MYSLANAKGMVSSSTLSQLLVSRCRLALMSVLGLHHADVASSPSSTGLGEVVTSSGAAGFDHNHHYQRDKEGHANCFGEKERNRRMLGGWIVAGGGACASVHRRG